ncbi:Bug family tripartite tricarboxylate transporter substrate binding protein [Falsiroseomonas sp. E2-1-a20]|uniref:Bug family tripartite tricarboxylate transporter substrate binding protein n=1 Tax=Falsiroseomonas sp. E2-1-a20 TaxID=3239300 RepID=UPI003F33C90B
MSGTGRRTLLGATAAVFASRPGLAQDTWPSRTIRLVVPYAAGGSSDIVARLIAPRLQASLGQSVVVENRAGAGALLGTEAVARAGTDGHTILLADTPHAILPALNDRLPYHPTRDFTPISLVAATPQILFAAAGFAPADAAAAIAAARARPDGIAIASAGQGTSSHLTAERLQLLTGIKLTHVPYRGAAPAMNDLAAGQVQLFFATIASGLPLLREGRIKALGVLSEARLEALPQVATFREQGIDLVVESWFALLGPAGIPEAVARRTAPAVAEAVAAPEVRERFATLGLTPRSSTPAEAEAFIRAELDRYAEVVRAADIRLTN